MNISRTVDSLTWETLPGADVNSLLYMVWIESITTTAGWTDFTIFKMVSSSTSAATSSSGETVFRRLLRMRICRIDSSPET